MIHRVILLNQPFLREKGYDSVRCTWPFYLIIFFLREGYDSVRWCMIKLRMAMLGYDLVNFRSLFKM